MRLFQKQQRMHSRRILFSLFLNYVQYMSAWGYVHMSAGALQARGIRSDEAGVKCDYDSPSVGAGN